MREKTNSMSDNLSFTQVKKKVFLIPIWQLLVGLIVFAILFVVSDFTSAIAGLYGSLVGVVGSLVFAGMVFGFGSRSGQLTTGRIFKAEAIKFLVVAILFYLAFAELALPFLSVIVGFFATLIVFILALLMLFR